MEKISEDIHLYKEFLTKNECKKTLDVLFEYSERFPDYWKGISFYESYSAGYPPVGDPLFKKHGLPENWFEILIDRFKEAASVVAGVDKDKMSRISFHVQRWLPGAYAPLHSDNSNNEGVMGAFTRSRYAGFMYLNDEFEGGLLKFQVNYGEKQLDLKPETGMFAIFHGGHKNMHEVSVIKHGTRYTLGSFWDDREESDYPQETLDIWAAELAEVRAMQKDQNEEWSEIKKQGKRLDPYGIVYDASEVE
jgi:hypothetical protein